jgi:hypothetical protein
LVYTFEKKGDEMARTFTLQEANETLTTVLPIMDEIQSIRRTILEHQPELWSMVEQSAGNGGNLTLSKLQKDFDRFDQLVHQILDLGIEIKDINTGLIDFPALKDGRAVYLCWRYKEECIQFWHEIDDGFAGRQPIETF